MCSELFRIPYVWGGVPIFGVGVLLAIWAIACAATLVTLVRQHGWSADVGWARAHHRPRTPSVHTGP